MRFVALIASLTLIVGLACSSRADKTPPPLDPAYLDPNTAGPTVTPRAGTPTPIATATPIATVQPATLTYSGSITIDGAAVPGGVAVEIRAGSRACGTGVITLAGGVSTYSVEVASDCGGNVARELYVDGMLIGKVSAAGGSRDFALVIPTPTEIDAVPTPIQKAVANGEWANAICSGITAWLEFIRGNADELKALPATTDLVARRDAIVVFLNEVLESTDELITAGVDAGEPDTADGPGIAAAFVRGFAAARSILLAARDSALALPTHDPGAFPQAARALVRALDDGGAAITATFQQVDVDFDTTALAVAMREQPSCAVLYGATNPFETPL